MDPQRLGKLDRIKISGFKSIETLDLHLLRPHRYPPPRVRAPQSGS